MKSIFSFALICTLFSSASIAQDIYGVWENQGSSVYYFAKVDPTTASKTNITSIPNMNGIIAPNNTCIRADSNWYIARVTMGTSQYQLLTIDIQTGSILYNVSFPGTFVGFEWSESNDSIYCLYHDNSTSYQLARVDPISGNYTLFPAISGVQAYVGESFVLDQNSGYYSFRAYTSSGYRFLTLDITNGSVVYDNPMTANVRGFEYNCVNDSIYALKDNSSADYDYVSISNVTGAITVIDQIDNVNGSVSYTASLDAWQGTYSFYGFAGSASQLIRLDAFTGQKLDSATINHNMAGWEGYESCLPTPPPIVDFIASDTLIGEGDSIDFTDLSSFSPTSWNWTFQGGSPSTSSQQHPTNILYNASGCYDVTLIASNGQGADTLTKSCYIEVVQKPEALFVADTQIVYEGGSVNFFDSSLYVPTQWSWNFSGALPPTSNDEHPAGIIYPVAGVYPVSLIASNLAGSDTATDSSYILVYGDVDCDFFADDTVVNIGDTVYFTDQSDGPPSNWNWQFQSGSPSSSSSETPPGIVYSTAGCFEVTLQISNPFSTDTCVKTCYIEVLPEPVVANFIADNVVIQVGDLVDYTDLSTNAPSMWSWQFQGGFPDTSSTQHPQDIQYNQTGCFNVVLTASNATGGSTETKVCYITVEEPEGLDGLGLIRPSLFPNPFQSDLVISMPKGMPCHLTIRHIDGRIISSQIVQDAQVISTSRLSAGIYFFECLIDGELYTMKAIKHDQ